MRTFYHVRKNKAGQGDDFIIGCLLHYSYFEENYKLIATELRASTGC